LERRREGKRRHELVEVDVVKIAGGAVRINPVGVVLKPNLHHFMSHIQLSRHGSVTSIDCSAARIRAATLHSHLLALLLLALLLLALLICCASQMRTSFAETDAQECR
jgi:hypothetical protein